MGNRFRTYSEAKKYAETLNFKRLNVNKEWKLITKSKNFPNDTLTVPARVYKKQWKGWDDFLGKKKKS